MNEDSNNISHPAHVLWVGENYPNPEQMDLLIEDDVKFLRMIHPELWNEIYRSTTEMTYFESLPKLMDELDQLAEELGCDYIVAYDPPMDIQLNVYGMTFRKSPVMAVQMK